MLTDAEREHLFLLGLGRPPEVRYQNREGVTPRLQRVLDVLEPSPALIRTAIWDVVAWNRAATVMLTDYASIPAEQRNILRFIFFNPQARASQYDWTSVARYAVGAFRVDVARAGAAQKVLQATLNRYDTGLIVQQLNFQNVRPPQEVKEAFDDAISAREDRQRRSNEADAYAKSVIPNARGDAARILAEAEGYKAERIATAEGDAQRFSLIESEYKAAPEVTRKRLYIETMQKVLAESSKVIDLSGGKNLLYLPIDAGRNAPTVEAVAPAVVTPDAAGKGGR